MIIGLGFKARTGKGEVASWLVRRHGFIEVAFADALKRACVEIFGLTESQVYGDQKDRPDPFWNDTPRNILQKVGTECLRRGYRDDVWIKALEREIRDPASPETVDADWVVSDCRFPNECEAIREWGGKLVRIERPDAPSIATGQHASETALERWCGWDYQLINNLTLDDLHAKVDIMLEVLRRNPADDDLSLKGPAGSRRAPEFGVGPAAEILDVLLKNKKGA